MPGRLAASERKRASLSMRAGLRLATPHARARGFDRTGERRPQAAQLVLRYDVVGARLHGRHGDLLADRAGYDEKRQLGRARPGDLQRLDRAEPGQPVVAEHTRPAALVERLLERGALVDADRAHRAERMSQARDHELVVVFGILDDDQCERIGCGGVGDCAGRHAGEAV